MKATAAQRITFTVLGRPVPAVRMTFAGVRNPKHNKRRQLDAYLAYKESVGWAAKAAGATPLSGALSVRLWIYVSRRGRQRGDIDNLVKTILDGMRGVTMADDSQVDHLLVQMRHVTVDRESVDVEIERIA